jgi:hypothetical protein
LQFLSEELQIEEQGSIGTRQKEFHHNNDNYITIDDLWHRWVTSPERKWTVEETQQWLLDDCDLPQYVATFEKHHVDGKAVARCARAHALYAHLFQDVVGEHKLLDQRAGYHEPCAPTQVAVESHGRCAVRISS